MAIKDFPRYSGLMSAKTAAKFLDCSVDQVYSLDKAGYLIPFGSSGFKRYDPKQILAGMRRLTRDRRRFKVNEVIKEHSSSSPSQNIEVDKDNIIIEKMLSSKK